MHALLWMTAVLLAIVPPPRDSKLRVHDLAGLLSPEQRESLERLAQDVERQTTAQLAVVTVPSLEGRTVEDYAHELFNTWGIGQRDTNNGVLFLVAPKERRMRIEVGYGLEPLLTDSLCGAIRDEAVIPRFKQNDYPGGIRAGSERLAAALKGNPQAARGVKSSAPFLLRTARREALVATGGVAIAAIVFLVLGFVVMGRRLYSTTTFLLVTIIGLVVLGAAAYFTWRTPKVQMPWAWFSGAGTAWLGTWLFNLGKYRRYGPHGCSKCGTALELLSEQEDDPKLEPVQRLEEKIGSVDYDVWICPACLNTDTERYIKPFSAFKECPQCRARTFKEDPQRVTRAATFASAGSARIEGRCVSCNHKTVRLIVLPILVAESTSSGSGSSFGSFGGGGGGGGGGSFGGGSSGGGGASGGW
ncbi:MAG: YgcG family protein [Pirellulales bacterium]